MQMQRNNGIMLKMSVPQIDPFKSTSKITFNVVKAETLVNPSALISYINVGEQLLYTV